MYPRVFANKCRSVNSAVTRNCDYNVNTCTNITQHTKLLRNTPNYCEILQVITKMLQILAAMNVISFGLAKKAPCQNAAAKTYTDAVGAEWKWLNGE